MHFTVQFNPFSFQNLCDIRWTSLIITVWGIYIEMFIIYFGPYHPVLAHRMAIQGSIDIKTFMLSDRSSNHHHHNVFLNFSSLTVRSLALYL